MKNLHSLLELNISSATFREARLVMMGLEGKGAPTQTPEQKEAASLTVDFAKHLANGRQLKRAWKKCRNNPTAEKSVIKQWLTHKNGGGFKKVERKDAMGMVEKTEYLNRQTNNLYSEQKFNKILAAMHKQVKKGGSAEKTQPKGINSRQEKLIKSIDGKVQNTVAKMVQKYIFPQTGVAVDKNANAKKASTVLNGFLKPKGMNATVELKLMGQQLVTQVNYVSGGTIEPHINTPRKRAAFIKNLQALKSKLT